MDSNELSPTGAGTIATHVPAIAHSRTSSPHMMAVTPIKSGVRVYLASFNFIIESFLIQFSAKIIDLFLKGFRLFKIRIGTAQKSVEFS